MNSGFQIGFLDFRLVFWISEWISGFQSGFLDFRLDSAEISFVTDPSPRGYRGVAPPLDPTPSRLEKRSLLITTSNKKFSEGKQVHVGMEASKTNQTRWE